MRRDGRVVVAMICAFAAGRLSAEPVSFWRISAILGLGIAAGLIPGLIDRWRARPLEATVTTRPTSLSVCVIDGKIVEATLLDAREDEWKGKPGPGGTGFDIS